MEDFDPRSAEQENALGQLSEAPIREKDVRHAGILLAAALGAAIPVLGAIAGFLIWYGGTNARLDNQQGQINDLRAAQEKLEERLERTDDAINRLTNAVQRLDDRVDPNDPLKTPRRPQSFFAAPENQGYNGSQDSALPPSFRPQTPH